MEDPDPVPSFAEVLRRLRSDRGLSLRDFQRVAQHSRTLVWEWEHGRKVPAPGVAARLDVILDAGGELSAAAASSTPMSDPTTLASEIARLYAHQGPAADEIRLRAIDARELDVLAVRALGLFALKDSVLRPALMDRSTALRVRVLLLDPDCDAATQRANEIRESTASFAAGIKLAIARLAEVAAAGMPVDLDVRLYSSLPVWRIIRVDETTWVSSFSATWRGMSRRSTRSRTRHAARSGPGTGASSTTCMPMPAGSSEETAVIEAELKARLGNPDAVRAALAERAVVERAVYRDTYYDSVDGALESVGRELRLRTIETPDMVRHVLTFKEPAVDAASGSKPEYETTVAAPDVIAHVVEALGCTAVIALTKDCENYRFSADGRDFLATVVRVPEIDGTFLELETMAADDQVDSALDAVRAVLEQLGVAAADLTSDLYTDAVRSARAE